MKRRILFFLAAIFICSASGAALAVYFIQQTTDELNRLVSLHQIEDLRKGLIQSIQSAQTDLHTVRNGASQKLDVVVEDIQKLDASARRCSGCHHEAPVAARLAELESLVGDYQNALSAYITASANSVRVERLKLETAAAGNRLLGLAQEMSISASGKLEQRTAESMDRIGGAKKILYATVVLTFLFGAGAALSLIRTITQPVEKLLSATRRMTLGNLGETVDYRDRTEFGELATNFNLMSIALKDGFSRLEGEIRERKQAADALTASEHFMNTVFDSIRDPFCVIDRSFRIVRANDAYAEMKGIALTDLIDRTCYETLYGRSEVCGDCIIGTTFRSGDVCAKEKTITTKDGLELWIEIFTYPVRDGHGSVTHVIEYIRDITERKRTEEALRESQERYALAARGANDGLWDWDLKANRVYYSPRWKEMLGFAEDEIGDSPSEWLDRVYPEDRKTLEAKMAAHLAGSLSHLSCEFRIRQKSGDYAWILCRGLAVRDREAAVYRMAGSQTDITAQKDAQMQLLHDAFHDALTGLPNRALFLDRLQHAIKHAKRVGDISYAVLFLDVDRFKVINDSLGHPVGDELLVGFGRRLATCVRADDTVARFGGDEFAVLLEHIEDLDDVLMIADRMVREIPKPFAINGHTVMTSASIGIVLDAKVYASADEVLRDADIALYQAKAKGKARYEIFDAKMHANIIERLQLEGDLRMALERKEFTLHYQPIIDLQSGKTVGYEALVRWHHPTRGILYPLEFIPLAEETGMIGQLGDWILREGCRQLAAWQRDYPSDPPLKLSLNISAKQFAKADLLDHVSSVIDEFGISPESLALEITESILMDHSDAAGGRIRKLREMGIHIHIDDFGTGYSSLSYIHELPVTALKIDRTFINRMAVSAEKREIIRTIVALARTLGLDVIAEGLELDQQLNDMKRLQCRYGQGYLFARPMPQDAAEEWMKGSRSAPADANFPNT